MLYLSRLILDIRNRQVRRDLADCYQLHRTLLAAFPAAPDDTPARQHYGVLYRVEPVEQSPALLRILVQSLYPPDWTHLTPAALGPAPDHRGNPAVRRIDQEYALLRNDMPLHFRLRANPTKRLSDRTTDRNDPLLGKRVALLREHEQLDWLARKGQQGGFVLLDTATQADLPAVQVAAQTTVRGRRAMQADTPTMPLRFGAVMFQGQLRVTDPDLFRTTLIQGIGSGKAFGFGLLSIASH